MSNLSGSIRGFSLRASILGSIILLVAVWALPAHAESQARIVRLSDVQGSVQIDKKSGTGLENAFLNLPVTQGTRICTRDNGRAEIEFEDGSTLRLAPNSKLDFSALGLSDAGARISVINLAEGTAYVNWLGKAGDRFTLNFSGEKVDLDRAAHFRVNTSPELTKFAVFKGAVEVAGSSGAVTVARNKMAVFHSDDQQATFAKNIEPESLDSWDKQAIAYHDEYAQPSKYDSSPYGYGLSDLNYFGAFTPVPGYGMMWQPFFAGAGWDPFMDGAWSWYPGMGYIFVSAYPWGWMPYRYGNWMSVPGFGWMWQPGYWNTWMPVPRYAATSAAGFHAPVVPTGTVSTVVVGRGGPVLSPVMPSRLIITRGSAGIQVPRGALGDLKSLNRQVAKSGLIQMRPAPQFAATSSPAFGTHQSDWPGAASAGSSIPPSTRTSNVSSSHAGSGEHH